jgi:hypothetical protein
MKRTLIGALALSLIAGPAFAMGSPSATELNAKYSAITAEYNSATVCLMSVSAAQRTSVPEMPAIQAGQNAATAARVAGDRAALDAAGAQVHASVSALKARLGC